MQPIRDYGIRYQMALERPLDNGGHFEEGIALHAARIAGEQPIECSGARR
ncbi:MAG: hypothetical protein J7551_08170 [Chloroflexi bacterium]|nr:hypothetical protein [Chloroflexota bacterium]